MNFILTKSPKSKGLAILLVAILGPLGLFYSSVIGGVVMTLIAPIAIIILFIKGVLINSESILVITCVWAFLAYTFCFIWAIAAVDDYNSKIISESSVFMSAPIGQSKELIYENLERIKRLHDDKVLNAEDYEKQKDEYITRIKEIDQSNYSNSYQKEYEKNFPNKQSSNVQNWIIVVLIIAIVFTWLIYKFIATK